jgi:hypothetical protein
MELLPSSTSPYGSSRRHHAASVVGINVEEQGGLRGIKESCRISEQGGRQKEEDGTD